MANLSLELPMMYGDHHVKEVRRVLLEVEGVKEVYASSSFHTVDVSYDTKKTNKKKLIAALDEAGYSGELAIPLEPSIPVTEREGEKYFRHTVSSPETQNIIGFEQNVGYEGRSKWPIPGMGILDVAETQTEESN
jgi:copper chaperone CopZ